MDPPGALRRRGAARHACRDQRQVLRSAVPGHVLGQPRRTVPGGSTVTDLATPGGVLGRYARLQRRRTLVPVALAAGVDATSAERPVGQEGFSTGRHRCEQSYKKKK